MKSRASRRLAFPGLLAVSGLSLLLASCATLKPPTLQVEALHMGKVGITGSGFDVGFRVQNPNPAALLIERFEYELKLNGHGLGRGYYSDPLHLEGFKAERVSSRFNLNFFSLPGTVKAVLDQDRAKVEIKGAFYVREGQGLKKLGFKSGADLDLNR